MADIQTDIATATARLIEVEKLIADKEQAALAHEADARKLRSEREELKKERVSLHTVLAHQRTISATEAAKAAAQQAQADTESSRAEHSRLLSELTEKGKRLDELLAKAEAKG